MNLYDLAALVFVAVFAVAGFRLGLVRTALYLAGFALALFLALRLEGPLGGRLAGFLHTPPWGTELATFAVILIVVSVVVHIASVRIAKLAPDTRATRLAGRIGGVALGVLAALLPIWLATGLLLLVPSSAAPLARAAHQSSTARAFATWTPSWPQGVLAYVGKVAVGPQQDQLIYELQHLFAGGPQLLQQQEAQMLELLNQTRRQFGLPPLRLDPELTRAARAHSADMAANNYFEHDSPRYGTPMRRMQIAGVRASFYGENIAFALDASLAETAFMHSPGHRANILDPDYTRVGIGAVSDGLMVMFTQDFAGT